MKYVTCDGRWISVRHKGGKVEIRTGLGVYRFSVPLARELHATLGKAIEAAARRRIQHSTTSTDDKP